MVDLELPLYVAVSSAEQQRHKMVWFGKALERSCSSNYINQLPQDSGMNLIKSKD